MSRARREPRVDLALAREHGLTRRRVRADRADPRPHAELLRARHLLGDVVGALLVQVEQEYLKRLPTTGPHVLQGPGENAGVVAIGDGLAVVFKIESHNHPSFIEPRQGAATGVGGILRDIFTMGARPIASLDSLRFGPLDDPLHQYLAARRRRRHRRLRQLRRRRDGRRRDHASTSATAATSSSNAFNLGVRRGRPHVPREGRRASATR